MCNSTAELHGENSALWYNNTYRLIFTLQFISTRRSSDHDESANSIAHRCSRYQGRLSYERYFTFVVLCYALRRFTLSLRFLSGFRHQTHLLSVAKRFNLKVYFVTELKFHSRLFHMQYRKIKSAIRTV